MNYLTIIRMKQATDQGRQQMAALAVQLLQRSPPRNTLNLIAAGFDSEVGEEICRVLSESSLTTLKDITLSYNPTWFDTDAKCANWASVFKK